MEGLNTVIAGNALLFWFLIAIAFGVFEAATINLVAIWFSIGALITMLPALMGASFNVQLAVFLAASIISMVLTRPFLKKILKVEKVPTNLDVVIGMKGVVISDIDNIKGMGRVTANGLDWAAVSADGTCIGKDEIVLVREIRGVKLVVERTNESQEEF